MTPLPIDAALSFLLTQRPNSYLKAVEEYTMNDRLYWILWNDLAESTQVWIARETVTVEDVDHLRWLIGYQPQVESVQFVGVIITTSAIDPAVMRYANRDGDILIFYQDVWIKKAREYMQAAPIQ